MKNVFEDCSRREVSSSSFRINTVGSSNSSGVVWFLCSGLTWLTSGPVLWDVFQLSLWEGKGKDNSRSSLYVPLSSAPTIQLRTTRSTEHLPFSILRHPSLPTISPFFPFPLSVAAFTCCLHFSNNKLLEVPATKHAV